MSKIKLLRTRLSNTDDNQQLGSKEFDTKDFVYVESYNDVNSLGRDGIVRSATDFAYANGCTNMSIYDKTPKAKHVTFTWLRTGDEHNKAIVSTVVAMVYGIMGSAVPYSTDFGACPCMAIGIENFVSLSNKSKDYKIDEVLLNGEVKYRIIEIPEYQYPQTCADKKTSNELEKLYKNGCLKKTGKTFTGSCIDGSKAIEEYELDGNFMLESKLLTTLQLVMLTMLVVNLKLVMKFGLMLNQ